MKKNIFPNFVSFVLSFENNVLRAQGYNCSFPRPGGRLGWGPRCSNVTAPTLTLPRNGGENRIRAKPYGALSSIGFHGPQASVRSSTTSWLISSE